MSFYRLALCVILAGGPAVCRDAMAGTARVSGDNAELASTVLTDTSLAPNNALTGSPVTITHRVSVKASSSDLSPAPMPDDEMDAPADRNSNLTDASLRPDFFSRLSPSRGDGFSNGSQVNEARRGRSPAAAGLALAVPLTQ